MLPETMILASVSVNKLIENDREILSFFSSFSISLLSTILLVEIDDILYLIDRLKKYYVVFRMLSNNQFWWSISCRTTKKYAKSSICARFWSSIKMLNEKISFLNWLIKLPNLLSIKESFLFYEMELLENKTNDVSNANIATFFFVFYW